ncbi:hypothetical protein [Streptomyces kronopolitis]|uniref:hypothetical protein n=1 Tax=Streptomyces kronopolitis TaxID=1612435 RepID=UPI003D95794D
MTFQTGDRGYELLARSHHSSHSSHSSYSRHSHYSTGHGSAAGIDAGGWALLAVGTVLGVGWALVKRRLRAR